MGSSILRDDGDSLKIKKFMWVLATQTKSEGQTSLVRRTVYRLPVDLQSTRFIKHGAVSFCWPSLPQANGGEPGR